MPLGNMCKETELLEDTFSIFSRLALVFQPIDTTGPHSLIKNSRCVNAAAFLNFGCTKDVKEFIIPHVADKRLPPYVKYLYPEPETCPIKRATVRGLAKSLGSTISNAFGVSKRFAGQGDCQNHPDDSQNKTPQGYPNKLWRILIRHRGISFIDDCCSNTSRWDFILVDCSASLHP